MDISKYWKTVVDTLQDGLMVMDPWGTILAANPAAEKMTGYTADELVGQSCRMLNCTGCKIVGKGSGENWCALFQKGKIKEKQCQLTNKNLRSVHIIKSASVLKNDQDKVIGAVETLTDISEKIRQQQEISSLKKTFHLDDGYHGIIGKSPVILNMFDLIENVAVSETPVMISGESGSGKELVARAIHRASSRSSGPYIKVNCAALNENLLESELFGHVKGAYTGADKARVGRFESAHTGTVFLDEIGDIPASIQVKLLRVLEEKKIERVGDNQPIPVDVRIITATHKDLEQQIEKGLFRKDLFFRINVFPLHCPSLSDRPEDIPLIARSFIQRNAVNSRKEIRGLSPDALEKMMAYTWPGNVRELRNAVEYAFVLCPGDLIQTHHLPPNITGSSSGSRLEWTLDPVCNQEREKMLKVLRSTSGNQTKAAEQLGVSRITVWKRIKKYGISLKRDL